MNHHTGHDLIARNDIELFLRSFYGRILIHHSLREKFKNVNMEKQLPAITDFWCNVVFAGIRYPGEPLEKTDEVQLQPACFREWMKIFTDVMNELYAGPRAEEMKTRAGAMALICHYISAPCIA